MSETVTQISADWLADGADEEFHPLTSPGMPLPGPDFIEHAIALGDPKPKLTGAKEDKRLLEHGPVLTALYRKALYDSDFSLPVKVKGRVVNPRFIPGHLWGGPADGPRPAEVMVLGKWPGPDEVDARRNFVGASGEILAGALEEAGSSAEEWHYWYVTNVVKFPNVDPAGQKPTATWIKDCALLLTQELRLVRPKFVLCLGAEAAAALVSDEGGVQATQGRVMRKRVRVDRPGEEEAWHEFDVMTCLHPAAVARMPERTPELQRAVERFVRHVKGLEAGIQEEVLDHEVVWSAARLATIVDEIVNDPDPARNFVALDCEWHGEHPLDAGSWLRTIQFSNRPRFAVGVVLRRAGGEPCFAPSLASAVAPLRRLFTAVRPGLGPPRLVGHNLRADLPWVQLGFDKELGDVLIKMFEPPEAEGDMTGWELTKTKGGFDTMFAAHAVRETDLFGLDMLALNYCGVKPWDRELVKWKKAYCKANGLKEKELDGYGSCPDSILHPYSLMDADSTARLFLSLNGRWLDCDAFGKSSRRPFWITQRASPSFLEMETTGLLIDVPRGAELSHRFVEARDGLLTKIQTMANWPTFSPRSWPKCRTLLFGPQYSGSIDKKTGLVKDIRPEGARSLGLFPVKTTGKPSRDWERVARKHETHIFTPATDKESLGILALRLKGSAGQADQPGYEEVVTLRTLRFADQVLKSVLCAPTAPDEDNDEEGEEGYEKGMLSSVQTDGRVRTHYFQTKETGRASSTRPPIMNLSKRREKVYKQDILKEKYTHPIRSIVTAPPGCVLVEADYIGAELFMMAIQSGDPGMIDHCLRSNLKDEDPRKYDIHSNICVKAFRLVVTDHVPDKKDGRTAAQLLGLAIGSTLPASKYALGCVGKEYLRDVAKTLAFGIPYGRGDQAVVRAVEEEGVQISLDEAAVIRQAILDAYPLLGVYLDECVRRVEDPGYVVNCFGRLRRAVRSRKGDDSGEMGRQFMNYGIQSGVADSMSTGLYHLHNYPGRRDEQGFRYLMNMQLHDAVMAQVRLDSIKWYIGTVLPDCLTNKVPVYACDLDGVPRPGLAPFHMGVESSVYLHWGEKIDREEGLAYGVPEQYLPEKK